MKLPDSFPKQFTITLVIDMKELLDASMTEWGRVLKRALDNAEATSVEQVRDYRMRHRIFEYYGMDVGSGFKFDYNYNWVTTDDGVIQLLRMDFLPLSIRALDFEMGLHDGTYEEIADEEGEILIRKVPEDLKTDPA